MAQGDKIDSGAPMRIQTQREQDIVDSVFREFSQLQAWRSTFQSHWEEVAELVLPTSRNTFFYGSYNYPGQKKTDRQVDSSAALALSRFGAILDSLLTPRNMTWHSLEADNAYVQKQRGVRLWFEDTNRRLFKMRYSPLANFSGQNQQNYQSLGAFGNGAMFIDEFDGAQYGGIRGLRYKALPLGELFFHENHQGMIDGFIRWFRLTARQAYQKWGDAVPEQMKDAMSRNSESLFDFYHCVRPRTDYDPQRLDVRGKQWGSYYISVTNRQLMQEGGYSSFPAAISRYDQAPGEVYGRGVMMMVLPSIKTINAEKTTFLKAGHRAADPVLLLRDDGIAGMSMRPGAMNKGGINDDGKVLVGTVPIGNIQISKEMMDAERETINDAALVTLFQILTETPTMTATEVVERTNEKGILLAPTLGRQQSEYLGPMIDRELDLMAGLGLLLPMPPVLKEARGEYHVVYTSPLSRAQRSQEVAGVLRTLESTLQIVNATQDSSLLDPFEFDTIIPAMASIQAVPESWMASDQKIALKRQARAQQQKTQENIQAAPAAAAMLKAKAMAARDGGALNRSQAGGFAAAPAATQTAPVGPPSA